MNEKEKLEQLTAAVKALLSKRCVTEWTHEQAYDFTFKSWGRDEWDKLLDLTGWTEADISDELKRMAE
jgi:hypothetical protein